MTALQLILDRHDALPGIDPGDWALLPKADQERAGRYRREQDRQQFIRARASLRRALATRMKVPASAVIIACDEFGKPHCELDQTQLMHPPVCAFNVSHTAGAILIGLADTALGVDIERTGERSFTAAAMASVFTEAECVQLRQDLAPLDVACLRHWTRKEAIMKADGRGMSLSAIGFEVCSQALATSRNHALDRWQVQVADRTWFGASAMLSSGYVCSVAVSNETTREQALRALEAHEQLVTD